MKAFDDEVSEDCSDYKAEDNAVENKGGADSRFRRCRMLYGHGFAESGADSRFRFLSFRYT